LGDAGAHAIAVSEASDLLRPGLLEGTRVLVAGGSGPARVSEPASTTGSAGTTEPLVPLGIAVGEACVELGARVHTCDSGLADEAIVDEIVTAAVAELGSLDLLVVDGAGLFAQEGLRNCLDATWNFTRAVVNLAFLPSAHGGRIVYLAPAGGIWDGPSPPSGRVTGSRW
jgi:NAD(P)-dependent dehydrogenase (short-subunit alcohol dehydrogenase family)